MYGGFLLLEMGETLNIDVWWNVFSQIIVTFTQTFTPTISHVSPNYKTILFAKSNMYNYDNEKESTKDMR